MQSLVAPMRHTRRRNMLSLRCCSGLLRWAWNSWSVWAFLPMLRTMWAIVRSSIAILVSLGSSLLFVYAMP